jgi:nucleotide-binding universal stress UspA family protein
MIEWKKICCAVDFGDPSRIAMAQAADLARLLEAELVLVHVFVPPPPSASDVLVSPEISNVDVEQQQELLERWRTEAEHRAGRPTRARVLRGAPAAKIVQLAREERCDLVVVGTHGRSGIPRVVLGSVAERVARQCECPVLVVHDHAAREKQELAEELALYH